MNDRFSRQSFLGEDSEARLLNATVGIAGLGGGGSHIVQQLAHLGCGGFVLWDSDRVEESNLNRMVGATLADSQASILKVDVARRMIRGLMPDASVDSFPMRWQDAAEPLRNCDIVVGCVDRFSEREQLEAACRRFLIPYVDIGLDVFIEGDEPPVMGGQVLLSMPGSPCLRCFGFITDSRLALEASRYGDAGHRPQVVWGNGALASAAVGVVVDLLTDWTRSLRGPVYLEYRGNDGTIRPHPRLIDRGVPAECPHHPPSIIGEPKFRAI